MLELPLFVVLLSLAGFCLKLQNQLRTLRKQKSTIVFVDKEGNKREVNPLSHSCQNPNCKLYGKKGKGNIKKRKIYGICKDKLLLICTGCGKDFSETRGTAFFNKKKPIAKIINIVKYLSEGGEIRKAGRIFKVSKDTVIAYLKAASKKARLINNLHNNMKFAFLQFDELWSFIFKKDKNLKEGEEQTKGSFWGYISYAFKHRFIVDIHNGKHNEEETIKFVEKQKKFIDIEHYVLIMSDGLKFYLTALFKVFGQVISYKVPKGSFEIVLPKTLLYGQVIKKRENGVVVDIVYKMLNGYRVAFEEMLKLAGCKNITTSLIERVNLSLRHLTGRFRRKGMGFSKCISNHEDALAFFQAVYNYATSNRGLKGSITPAMSVGLSKRVWTIEDILRFQPDAAS